MSWVQIYERSQNLTRVRVRVGKEPSAEWPSGCTSGTLGDTELSLSLRYAVVVHRLLWYPHETAAAADTLRGPELLDERAEDLPHYLALPSAEAHSKKKFLATNPARGREVCLPPDVASPLSMLHLTRLVD